MQIKILIACSELHEAFKLAQRVQEVDEHIAAAFTDVKSVLAHAGAAAPQVLLLEYPLKDAEIAVQMLSRFRQMAPSTRILLLCDALNQDSVITFIQRGVSGYLLASSPPALYARAVRTVQQGETWFGRAELLQALRSQIGQFKTPLSEPLDGQELLTAREREILSHVGSALSNKEIARRLQISDNTVKTHLHRIYVKLHKSGRYKAFLSDAVIPQAQVQPRPHAQPVVFPRALNGDLGGE